MNLVPMTNDQIRSVAPSAFAEHAHESRSSKYAYIPTSSVIDAMRSDGFFPVSAQQSRSRLPDMREFTKHMIRFRRPGEGSLSLGQLVPEIVLINSHGGQSAYNLLAGIFRCVCTNGLIASVGEYSKLSIAHKGDVRDRVVSGSYNVIDQSTRSIETAQQWAQIELQPAEVQAFGQAAAALRFGGASQSVVSTQLVAPRRVEDQPSNLWNVFNRAQEGLIRGGARYVSDGGRRQRAREVRSIDQNVGLNTALWTLATEMAKLKA